ncbi:hypothetical protein [Jatrophihabitans sp.]|uniref:hypothetical protein n=1 Tax=Jatrophihabitans sp. TaxID=1932789 RepID=UPI002CBA43F3|nr:hypothetical protein [Jatrophihabitans sp.]
MASTPGTGPHGDDEDPHPDETSLQDGPPNQMVEQTCAFCGCRQVVWVHPLATDRVLFRRFGKDEVVPSFWGMCESCEQLYQNGQDDELIALMKSAGGWVWQGTEVDDVLRKPVDVFREADLGRRPVGG